MTATQRIWLILWAISMVLGIACAAVFGHTVMRDHRVGEPDLAVDLSEVDSWVSTRFRVWGETRFRLFISSVNHAPRRVGRELDATIEVAVLRPDGSEEFRRIYEPGTLEHAVPDNYGDTQLAKLTLEGWGVRRWHLRARVTEPDPDFEGVFTEVKLWVDRPVAGMGGLIFYVFIFPAALFVLLGFIFAAVLFTRGVRWPLFISLPFFIAFMVLFSK